MITAKVVTMCGGYKLDQESFDKLNAQLGDEFEVGAFSIGQSKSSVQLAGVGFHNPVFFEFYEDGEPLNPYVDKRFNWYL